MYYFAYADNMDEEKLAQRGIEFKKVITGRIKGMRLVFHKPGEDGTGKADMQSDRGNFVEGVIWDVPEAALDNLDMYEGVDRGHYRRQTVTVQTSRGELECVTYGAAKFRQGLKPGPEYLESIIRGAGSHRLSPEYIRFLKSHDTTVPQA